MSDEVFLSGTGETTTQAKLSQLLDETDAQALYFASAYVTQSGVNRIADLIEEHQIERCIAVFGLNGNITQPSAIDSALELGWTLRLIEGGSHQFHPKIALVGGVEPKPLSDVYGGYIGSSNITKGGLVDNIEAGLIVRNNETIESLSETAGDIWKLANPVEDVDIEAYAERYAENARERPTSSQPPGVGASPASETETEEESEPPEKPAYQPDHARAGWAGLESFTGDYTFQVEFPGTAGEVINEMVGAEEEIDVLCSDEKVREMLYDFYEDNGMFRLNIPNEVPGVQQARREESGIAIVSECDESDATLELEIINEDDRVDEFVRRSKREGSWDKTPTRLYGWF